MALISVMRHQGNASLDAEMVRMETDVKRLVQISINVAKDVPLQIITVPCVMNVYLTSTEAVLIDVFRVTFGVISSQTAFYHSVEKVMDIVILAAGQVDMVLLAAMFATPVMVHATEIRVKISEPLCSFPQNYFSFFTQRILRITHSNITTLKSRQSLETAH